MPIPMRLCHLKPQWWPQHCPLLKLNDKDVSKKCLVFELLHAMPSFGHMLKISNEKLTFATKTNEPGNWLLIPHSPVLESFLHLRPIFENDFVLLSTNHTQIITDSCLHFRNPLAMSTTVLRVLDLAPRRPILYSLGSNETRHRHSQVA